MDIASPWYHRVYEKEGLKWETGKLWGIKQQEVRLVVVGALGAASKRLDTWPDKLGITIRMGLLQKQHACWEQQGT